MKTKKSVILILIKDFDEDFFSTCLLEKFHQNHLSFQKNFEFIVSMFFSFEEKGDKGIRAFCQYFAKFIDLDFIEAFFD